MLVLRGTVTQHPRGSTSTPAMSPHYWIPPTSVSCSGVTELQAILAPFSAAALLHQGASPPSPPTGRPSGVPAAETRHDGDAGVLIASSTEPSGAHSARQPPGEESGGRNLAFLITAAVAFAALVVIVLTLGRTLQPRDVIADEQRATDVERHPLVQELGSAHAYDDGVNAGVRVAVTVVPGLANHSVGAHEADHSYSETTAFLKSRRTVWRERRGPTTKSRKALRKRRQRSSTTTASVDEYSEHDETSTDTDMFSRVLAPSKNVSRKYFRRHSRPGGSGNTSTKFPYKRGTEIVRKPRHAGFVPHSVMNASAGVETIEYLD